MEKIEMTKKIFDEVVRYLIRRPYCEVKDLLELMDANCELVGEKRGKAYENRN